MLRWGGIICSSLTMALLGVAGFTVGSARQDCSGGVIGPPSPHCEFLYTVDTWLALFGVSLTVLLMVVFLIAAIRKRAWEWLLLLLVGPPVFLLLYAWVYNSGGGEITLGFCFALIGLPNLLVGIVVALKPTRGTPEVSPTAGVPPG